MRAFKTVERKKREITEGCFAPKYLTCKKKQETQNEAESHYQQL